jgi:3-oxoacyl-[acyl-carrier-protein] synthase-3
VSIVRLGADGRAAELIATDPDTDLIRMDGPETFKAAVRTMEEAVRSVCARAGVDPLCDVDLFVFHQANGRITRALAERLDLGNTSAASVPLALEQAREDGRLVTGSRVLLSAVGAGFVSAAALLEWGPS